MMKSKLIVIVTTIAALMAYQVILMLVSKAHYDTPDDNKNGVSQRAFPYPYRCGLAICSDTDWTGTIAEFLTIMEYLNTSNETVLGTGLGLEIGNSFYGTIHDDYFGFNIQDPEMVEVITEMIRLGYMDCIHSFTQAENREEIVATVQELVRRNCQLDVWVNHSNNASNVGSWACNQGDNVTSDIYHTDFSVPRLGLRFFWTKDVTSIVGQGRALTLPAYFSGFDRCNKLGSLKNFALKEMVKFSLAPMWGRYSTRLHNDLIWPVELEDGQRVFGFSRCNMSSGQRSCAGGLAENLRPGVLQALVDSEGYMVIYTHIGKNDGYPYLSEELCGNLKGLAERSRGGEILVATTSRLLNYYANRKYLEWHSEVHDGKTLICVDSISDPVRGKFEPTVEDLQGATFYVEDPDEVVMLIGGEPYTGFSRNGTDHTRRKSVTIPWVGLESIDELMLEYRDRGLFGKVGQGSTTRLGQDHSLLGALIHGDQPLVALVRSGRSRVSQSPRIH